MKSGMVRVIAALVVALTAVGLSGCSRSSGGAPVGCVPRWPHVSQDVVRAGGTVTVSVSAATCRPTFDHARRLTIGLQDRDGGHAQRLATVQAFPSAAFERVVRIPSDTASGYWRITVDGVDVPCPDNASCASYETGVEVVDSSPDFIGPSTRANRIAGDVASIMQTALQRRASFFGIAIVPDGIEVVLHTTRRDPEVAAVQAVFAAARDGVPANERTVAGTIRLHTSFVLHSEAVLERLTLHIAHDATWQKQHGIEPSEWFPDSATDSVRIALRHYTDAAAIAVTKRYGESVTVSTVDTPFATAA